MNGTKIVDYAKKFLGVPYIYGGASPGEGFDSERFVIYCYKHSIGVTLPHFADGLLRGGTRVSQANLKLGDLVFTSPNHIGIFVGDNKIIHAPNKVGDYVKITEITSFYTAKRYIN